MRSASGHVSVSDHVIDPFMHPGISGTFSDEAQTHELIALSLLMISIVVVVVVVVSRG